MPPENVGASDAMVAYGEFAALLFRRSVLALAGQTKNTSRPPVRSDIPGTRTAVFWPSTVKHFEHRREQVEHRPSDDEPGDETCGIGHMHGSRAPFSQAKGRPQPHQSGWGGLARRGNPAARLAAAVSRRRSAS